MNRYLLLWLILHILCGCNRPPSTRKRPIPHDISEELRQAIKQLNSPVAKDRGVALLKLGDMEEEDRLVALPWVLDLLADNRVTSYIPPGNQVASMAAALLRNTNHEQVLKGVIKASKSENPTVREHAVWAFPTEFMVNKRAIPHVLKLTKDKHPEVRISAAKSLANISGKYYGDNPEAWQRWWEEYSGQQKDENESEKTQEDINADARRYERLFGPNTKYFKANDIFVFTSDKPGISITLYKVLNGNLSLEKLTPDEF